MKLGFLSSIVPELSFEQVIDFASENGFECVELACWPVGKATRRYAGVTHIDMSALDEGMVKHIRDYCAEKKVAISGIGYYPNPLSADPEARSVAIAHIKACIEGAEKLGVPVMNTFIGRNRLETKEKNWEEFKAVWPEIIRFAEGHNVKIGIENCPMYFWNEWPEGDNLAGSPAFWEKMFAEIPSDNFGLNYDPSHLVWQRMDYLMPIREYGNKIFHFHIKDAKFYPEKFNKAGIFAPPLEYHQPKLPGHGDIRWGDVISALDDAGYQGPMVIEIEDRAYEDSLQRRLDSILLSRDYIKQYLR